MGDSFIQSTDLTHIVLVLPAAFQAYAPKVYRHYARETQALYEHDHTLHPPFKNSVFPAATFNLGPKCVCRGHVDATNVPYGWCMVCALGRFDHKKGGHLVLLEFGLVIDFPAGSVVLIPSSVVRHGNTPIAETETRFSFTQYCAGGVLRWVDHGFVPEWSLLEAHRLEAYGRENERWHAALDMFSKLGELRDDFQQCFPNT